MKIKLYANHSVELYKQLVDQLLESIADGELQEGDKLPSVRQLATQLKVNPNTVQKAYQILHEKGVIFIEPKKRAVVKRHLAKEHTIEQIEAQLIPMVNEAIALGMKKSEFEAIIQSMLKKWG